MPVTRSSCSDLAAEEDLRPVPTSIRINSFLEPHPEDDGSLQRNRGPTGYPVDELLVDPLFKLDHRELRVFGGQSQRCGSIENRNNQLLSNMIGTCTTIQHGLDSNSQDLRDRLVLISTLFILHHLPPILRQLV
jgi:hypothetical protein